MPYTVVIPARFAATRLPGKPLREIAGKSLLQYVFECAKSTQAQRIIIATDDARIKHVAEGFGADVCMTLSSHESGTQRINEVIQKYKIPDDEVIVNLQGDEPLMPAACVDQVAELLLTNTAVDMATLMAPITHSDEIFNSNVVKVVTNKFGNALYFSRASIPWQRGHFEQKRVEQDQHWFCSRHIGIYAYCARYIKEYVNLSPSPLENIEKLEQLRVLWHGGSILVDYAVEIPGPGVDTEEDFAQVQTYIEAAAN